MASKAEQQVTMLISKRNIADYQYNAQILSVIPALRDSLIRHNGFEESSAKILWPTVDLFIDEDQVLQIIVMGIVKDEALDIAFRPTLTAVVPFSLVLEQDVDKLVQYYEFQEAIVDENDDIVDAVDSPSNVLH